MPKFSYVFTPRPIRSPPSPSPPPRILVLSLKVPTVEAKRRFRLWGRQDEEEPSVGAVIGAPFNVQHVTHVKPDSHSSTGMYAPGV